MAEQQQLDAPRVLVTGGGGYVAQFVLELLNAEQTDMNLFTTVRDTQEWKVSVDDCHVTALSVDFASPESIRECLNACKPHYIVHCAAISSPAFCEKNPETGLKVNSPVAMLEVLEEQAKEYGYRCSILYLSTDQVYGGGESPYKETGSTDPLNEYSKSKLSFEAQLQERWPLDSQVILRCSNIYGPLAPLQPIKGNKFLQWLDNELRSEKQIELFEDEYRSFVSVQYVAKACQFIVASWFRDANRSIDKPSDVVFNCGGPDGLNRVQVAENIIEAFDIPRFYTNPAGEQVDKIIPIPRSKANMPYNSGLDIAMDSAKLASLIGPDVPMLTTLSGLPA